MTLYAVRVYCTRTCCPRGQMIGWGLSWCIIMACVIIRCRPHQMDIIRIYIIPAHWSPLATSNTPPLDWHVCPSWLIVWQSVVVTRIWSGGLLPWKIPVIRPLLRKRIHGSPGIGKRSWWWAVLLLIDGIQWRLVGRGNTDGHLVTPTEFHSLAPGVTVSQSLMTRLHVEDNGNTVMDWDSGEKFN